MTRKILVPDLGDFANVDVIDVLVKEGDVIERETPLLTLETDKATMDVPSDAAGRITALKIRKGDKVSMGDVIAELEEADSGQRMADGAQTAEAAPPPRAPSRQPSTPDADSGQVAGSVREILVPDLGDFTDVDVIDVLVKEGDVVEQETPLITLETDKATMDVPSQAAGRITALKVRKGDKVSKGDVIAELEEADGGQRMADSAQAAAPAPAPAPRQPPAAEARVGRADEEEKATTEPSGRQRPLAAASGLPVIDEPGFSRAYASPSVRRFARELGVDLVQVKGSGRKGRITHEDVKGWVKQRLDAMAAPREGAAAALPPVPEVDFARFGPIEIEPLSRVQRISGPRLHASWVNVPHVWQMDEADITELETERKRLKDEASKRGIKLTPLAFIVRAVVRTLQEFPRFVSSLDTHGQNLVLKKYLHIGFAADTPRGLVVPVIRDADKKDVYELARELALLSEKARDGKLSSAEMSGGCFTISSLGGIGGTAFTPIINAPEVAILGVSRSSLKPVYQDGQFVARLMLPYALAYDHRVIDGADAVRFTTRLAQILADARGLLEAVP